YHLGVYHRELISFPTRRSSDLADNAGQGGMLGVCIDPNFKKNKMVYWVFSESMGEGNVTAVAKGRLSSNEKSLENATVIYRATPDRKSTRLNSSHVKISYAVFC